MGNGDHSRLFQAVAEVVNENKSSIFNIQLIIKSIKDKDLATQSYILNYIDEDGNTPLIKATENGHGDIVKLLFQAGADFEMHSKSGHSVLTMAASKGFLSLVKYYIEEKQMKVDLQSPKNTTKNSTTALIYAISGGHVEVVQYLVDQAEANINIRGLNDITPLIAAVRANNLILVGFLLERKAMINLFDANGTYVNQCIPQIVFISGFIICKRKKKKYHYLHYICIH